MKKCLLALALLFAVLLSGCAIVQTTDLADYGNTGGETWHGSAVFDLLFQHNILTYFALALAVFLAWFLNKTRKGLYLRAVGESPATADAAGINVTRYKYLATVLGGGISAIGGVAYITGIAGCVWNHEGLSGVGWLAVALVIFCLWKPSAASISARSALPA